MNASTLTAIGGAFALIAMVMIAPDLKKSSRDVFYWFAISMASLSFVLSWILRALQ